MNSLALTIISVGAVVEAIRRWIWPAVRDAAKAVARAWRGLQALVDIAAEFHPNGGASLRDTVNRIEHTSGVNANRLSRLEEHLGITGDTSTP